MMNDLNQPQQGGVLARKLKAWRSVFCIGVPTLLVLLYLLMLAEPTYETEAKFVVENNTDESMLMMPGITQSIMGGGGAVSLRDAYLIAEYMQSPDLVRHLDEQHDLLAHYAAPAMDVLRRLQSDATLDDLVAYLRKQLHVKVTPDSSVVTVSLKAFDPAYAQAVLSSMIAFGEETINAMNDRMLRSTTQLAAQELERAKADLKVIRQRMFEFQVERQVIRPKDEISVRMANLAQVDAKILERKTELRIKAQFLEEGAFELNAIRQQIRGLEGQRDEEAKTLFTDDLAGMTYYESLKLEAEFALHTFTASLAAHEKAKLEALRQEKFLLSLSVPSLPVQAAYPEPYAGTLIAFILFGLLYGIARLLIATILDHNI
jgi:capsular polysaccharide transport system permease protein